jgi:hypothetical protein
VLFSRRSILLQLSVWLEHGCGGSMRGALWTLGLTILQVLLTFCISMYVVLRTEYEWAKRISLTAMLIMQLLMAAWALLADPADHLEGIISCLVSLVEASATSILLAAAYLQDTAHKSSLKTMGLVSTGLLTVTVFAPICLLMYDSILLPTASAYQERKRNGQSAPGAVFGIALQLIFLPIVFIANLFGLGFRGIDVLEAAVGEANTTISDGAMSRCRASAASDQVRNSEDAGKPAGSLAPLTCSSSCLVSTAEEQAEPNADVKLNHYSYLALVGAARFLGLRRKYTRSRALESSNHVAQVEQQPEELREEAETKARRRSSAC